MKRVRNALVLAGTVLAVLVVPIAPAHANVGISTQLTAPSAVSVGQTGLAGSITTTNTNTPPNQAESNTVTSIRLVIGCAAAPAPPNPCPTPDLGVASIASPATGGAGTACAGVTFTASAPDAAGIVTFTPSSTVILAPPGGANQCTVNFSFSVLKVPASDVDSGIGGVQTFVNARVVAQNPAGTLMPANNPSLMITVNRGLPTLTTQVSPRVQVGGSISDTATVAGVAGIATPTGTVTFNLYGPSDPTCAASPIHSPTVALTAGTAQSTPFTANVAGFYRFVATYNGDAFYLPRTGTCGEPSETVEVTTDPPVRAVADFDGNGSTDVSVYRPSNGGWFVRNGATVSWGIAGDIPVPGDYDGNGATEFAVYRPSNGGWFINGGPSVSWGIAGDIPVPGDYDGNGSTDIAVYRPSNGGWFINGGPSVSWGIAGDIPVPGDYDGNGSTDIAVYRPSNGGWFVNGGASVSWGIANDVPVPGDYNGDGTTDFAVYRPSNGGWFVNGGASVSWGIANDVPVPGDYNGNGTTDFAVYRPSNGGWFVNGGANVSWGIANDIPLPLPYVIRNAYFP